MNDSIPLNRHPLAEARLTWMKEMQPNLLLEKYKDGTLKDLIIHKVEVALGYKQYLLNQGLPKWQVDELVNEVIAPAENLHNANYDKVSEALFQKIVNDIVYDT